MLGDMKLLVHYLTCVATVFSFRLVTFFSHPYSLKVTLFAGGTPYILVEMFPLGEVPSYSGTVRNYKIKAAGSSKTAQNLYRIRRCHVSEASTHHNSSGKVKFYLYCVLYSIISS